MDFLTIIGAGVLFYFFIKLLKSYTDPTSKYSNKKSLNISDHSNHSKINRINSVSSRDDDLATFSISYGQRENFSKNKNPGKWIKSGISCSIKGYEIKNGLFYFGGRLASVNGYGTEASLVDESLRVETQSNSYFDESLGYWPEYSTISAKCRGAYLNWMASSRDDPSTPTGYIFIYFYGLERRIVVDSFNNLVDDEEFKVIFNELLRLKKIYGESRSFLSYSSRLLELMCLLRPNVVSDYDMENNPFRDSNLFKYRLAKVVNDEKPIPADLALAWLKFFPDYNLKTPARRCPTEFGQLFNLTYTKKYGEGFIVKPNKTRLKIGYWPASSSLQGVNIPFEDLPDPSLLKSPISKLIEIADECTNALDDYSRYLGKKDTSSSDISAILLLPDDLSDISDNKVLREFKKWAEEIIHTKNGLVNVSEFWQFTQIPLPTGINKRESELIQSLAEKAGFGVAPDSRYHHAKPSVDGKLVLFNGAHGMYFNPSKSFYEMGIMLRLGAMVASIDLRVDQSGVIILKQLIDHDTNLSPTEKRSLHAYLIWRLNTSSNISGLKARLEKLNDKEKSVVSSLLIGVALADGKIDPDEVKELEKLYTLLGLDKSMVTRDIHSHATNRPSIRDTAQSVLPKDSPKDNHGDFRLDETLLAIHESQTKDVQNILGAIFVDEELEVEAENEVETFDDTEDFGIDSKHYELYQRLIHKDRWAREEVDELSTKLGLLTIGAIEIINDCSFERVNASVLEEEAGNVYVDQEIVLELEG